MTSDDFNTYHKHVRSMRSLIWLEMAVLYCNASEQHSLNSWLSHGIGRGDLRQTDRWSRQAFEIERGRELEEIWQNECDDPEGVLELCEIVRIGQALTWRSSNQHTSHLNSCSWLLRISYGNKSGVSDGIGGLEDFDVRKCSERSNLAQIRWVDSNFLWGTTYTRPILMDYSMN